MSTGYINEALSTPVRGEYDTVVVGGGVAGISAALASVRHGAKTLLIEREYLLGGLATLGLISIYLPLCDGMGRQCSFGIAEELLRLSISHGYEDKYPKPWLENGTDEEKKKVRFEVQYPSNVFPILAEQLLRDEGVDLLYGTHVCTATVNEGYITHIIVENKSGRYAIACKNAVDASGDAILCRAAGAPTEIYQAKNILAGWYYYRQNDDYKLHMVGYAEDPNKKSDDFVGHARFWGIEGDETSLMTEASHRLTLKHFLARGDVTERYQLTSVATVPQLRMTRRLVGEIELDTSDEHKYQPSSIGMITNWRRRGPVYEVPYETLFCNKVKNLAAAGRIISNTERMWDIARVIPCCAVTGQAAGTAAALSRDMASLDIKTLQNILRADGVILHENELEPVK